MPKSPPKMHPRNRHLHGYDLDLLAAQCPALTEYIVITPRGQKSVDFSNAKAVKILNQALLKCYYNVSFWDIPDQYLCPPIPGRVDYIHHLADLLAADNQGQIPTGRQVKALDIGTGANLVYPLTGVAEYGWAFTGSDIDSTSVNIAKQLAAFNQLKITIKQQSNPAHIFQHIITDNDLFHITMCNPPFHASQQDVEKGTARKWQNLTNQASKQLNFGGQSNELWCPGGEREFISNMINESQQYAEQCVWFSSLVSKKDSLPTLQLALKKQPVKEVKVVAMAQGQKVSRFLAWSYFDQATRQDIFQEFL
ncbi:23S rRNA (adenine(1618)-N(6))-methyltransferase RlmF [Pseudoalteromonas mariniglutinosa]|uniref:23S rRNA (adenine(1618)-N(6))-methyltransferase RlmF n=1 Tax=Pseudoalteromonas mariniglutinosa TaxID=206042 RepID=UPI00384D777B